MITFIIVKLKQLLKLPHFLFCHVIDRYHFLVDKWFLDFQGWGLHLYVGKFGAGKTATMVYTAYSLATQYKQLSILTNLRLQNFPEHTKILPLNHVNDILEAPSNCLVLIDEIGTVFNSRDFVRSSKGGKEGVPKILFQHLCQCRKRHMQILATTQRWNFLDKQLRDITASVTVTKTAFKHPFSRLCTCYTYDSAEYDLAVTNPMYPLNPMGTMVYVQSDKVRALYDTQELIENMLNQEYLSDSEILENRGDLQSIIGSEVTAKSKGRIKRTVV